MAKQCRVTAKFMEATGRPFSVVGTGNTQAEALAECQARAALVVGHKTSLQNATASIVLEDGVNSHANQGVYSDAILILLVGGQERAVKVENMSLDFNLVSGTNAATGLIDVGHATVLAFVNAYKDADNLPADGVVKGYWVK